MTPVVTQFKVLNGRLGLFAAVAAVMLTGAACRTEKIQAAPSMPPPLVTAANATARDVPRYLDEIGKNMAYEAVTVTPQVAGRIVERHFQDGENLRRGQLLFVIDPRPYKAQVDSAKATLAQAQAALDLAKIQFARDEAIIGTRAISQQDYDTKKNTVSVNQAQVQAAEAALETAKLNLEYCYIHSPIDGRAGARLVDVGNVVQTNSSPLLSIQRVDPIYATFTVTERDLPEVQKEMSQGGLKAMIRLPSDQESAARIGKVEFLDNSVQNGTGTINLRATISNPDRHFWPGQFVNVKLVLSTQKGAVLIPNQAVQISQKGPFVFVVKPDDTAEVRQLTLGQRQGDDVVVSDGVAPNERVVVAGQMTIRPGDKVRVDQRSAKTTSPENTPAPQSGSQKNGGRS